MGIWERGERESLRRHGITNMKVGVFEAAATVRLLFTGYFDEMNCYFEYDRVGESKLVKVIGINIYCLVVELVLLKQLNC